MFWMISSLFVLSDSYQWWYPRLCLHGDLSETGPERIQNWTCCCAGPVLDPLRTGSRMVPCKHLDWFHTVPCKQKPIRSGSVRDGSVPVPCPVPCKRSLTFYCVDDSWKYSHSNKYNRTVLSCDAVYWIISLYDEFGHIFPAIVF